jgi:DNA polymerase IV
MDRQIVCYRIPAFEIALARLSDSSLRTRPVGIAPACTPRACLHELSPEAQHAGLYHGISVEEALRLCPSLRILPRDPFRVRLAHQHLLDTVTRFAPVWEPVRPGYFFLDLTGTARLLGPAVDTAAHIEREVVERYRLPGVVGVGSNKLVSRVAAKLIQPTQLCDVRPGSERMFLAPLPVTVLPGLSRHGSKTLLALLQDLNLQTLGEIADVPLPHLAVVFGQQAALLHRWANGIDPSPVLPPVQHPEVETLLVVEPDEVDDGRLLGLLHGLLEELCQTLRRRQRVCRRLTLILLHSDRIEVARHQDFRLGTYWEVDMYPRLKELFFRCFQRRVRIRMMTLRADALTPPDTQLSLFDLDTPMGKNQARMRRLAVTLDRLRDRFGAHSLYWGQSGSRRTEQCRSALRQAQGERFYSDHAELVEARPR